jgi:hypothetical protein
LTLRWNRQGAMMVWIAVGRIVTGPPIKSI